MQLSFCSLRNSVAVIQISHIYREANNAADYLANLSYSFSYEMHLFDSPDRGLSH
ncbi:hypothetical protein LINGRAHAP2_LOCUS27737 [Linum grandiflorum]